MPVTHLLLFLNAQLFIVWTLKNDTDFSFPLSKSLIIATGLQRSMYVLCKLETIHQTQKAYGTPMNTLK